MKFVSLSFMNVRLDEEFVRLTSRNVSSVRKGLYAAGLSSMTEPPTCFRVKQSRDQCEFVINFCEVRDEVRELELHECKVR